MALTGPAETLLRKKDPDLLYIVLVFYLGKKIKPEIDKQFEGDNTVFVKFDKELPAPAQDVIVEKLNKEMWVAHFEIEDEKSVLQISALSQFL